MKKNNKGFTLAELLVVVAIIAVLVAISIPVFSAQLEKSREAADAANIRAAYAEASVAILDETSFTAITVDATQKEAGWQNGNIGEIGGQTVTASTTGWTISVVDGAVQITEK